jgi:hypothetical protein
LTPSSRIRPASRRTKSGGLRNSYWLKVIVHGLRVAIRGRSSTRASRSSNVASGDTPVESWIRIGDCSRMRSTVRRAMSRSAVGRWSASRRCTDTTDAPAACAAVASAAISSGVVGIQGVWAFVAYAPVVPTVMTTLFMISPSTRDGLGVPAGCHASGAGAEPRDTAGDTAAVFASSERMARASTGASSTPMTDEAITT